MYGHQEMPFEKLVEELRPERSLSHNPLFQVMFSLRNAPREEMKFSGLEMEFVGGGSERAKFDLSMFLAEEGGSLECRVEYDTDLFDEDRIERMLGHYRVLLEAAASDAEQRIGELPLMEEEEQRELVEGWNQTKMEFGPGSCCLHEQFEEQVRRCGEAVAVVCGKQQLTYGELNGRANQLAHYLREHGVGRGQRVGLYVGRSLDMMVGLLGIQKSGAAYVPLDPGYPEERIRQTLQEAQVALVVTVDGLPPGIAEHAAKIVCLTEERERLEQQSRSNPESGVSGEDLVYVIFTSGSTGRPKGVEVRHRSVVNLLRWMGKELEMGAGDVFPALASFAFDMSKPELYLGLVTGGKVVIGERHLSGNGEELAEFLRRHQATVVHATPTTWSLLLEAGFTGRGIKRAIGAEPLPPPLFRRLMEADASLYHFYGPTETTVWSTYHHFKSGEEPIVVGRPIANTQVYILDEHGKVCPVGVRGELYIGGEGIAQGYLNRPEQTAEKFIADLFSRQAGAKLYRTGDLVRYLPDGRIEFQGRADHQVKVRGYRIELEEIEARLAEHVGVREAVVAAREEEPGEKRLVAYYTATDANNPSMSAEILRAYLSAKLPEYMVPVAYVRLARMPLMANGKLDWKGLPAPERDAFAARGYEEPQGETERKLAAIWAEVLKVERVGRQDNFFELGGHSLLVLRVISRVRKAMNVEISLGDLFARPVLSGFAGCVETAMREYLPIIPRVDRSQRQPLSFAQQRLWFLAQMDGASEAYHIPFGLRLTGQLDEKTLRQALDRIVARHEGLRTTFDEVDGEAMQRIGAVEANHFHLIEDDLRLHSDVPGELDRLIAEEARKSFDLKAGPLIRGRLIRHREEEHTLLITMHHIVSDGWSMGVLIKELSVLYGAFARGEADPLPELSLQYADYAVGQRKWMEGDILQRQANYWRTRLHGAPALLEVPGDYVRPTKKDHAGDSVRLALNEELTAGLKELSRRRGTTMFMTLLAGWAALLSRLSGQQDVVIGTPVANRGRVDIEGLIGFFANTLALRLDVSGSPTVAALLDRVRARALEAQEHQDIPFEQVVELARPVRSLSHSPVFQVMFAWQNTPKSIPEFPGIAVRPLTSAPRVTAKFDLTLLLQEAGDQIVGRLEYATSLFRQSTIERYLGHFRRLLEAIVEDDSQLVDRLPLLTEAERKQVVHGWNDTRAEYPKDKCIHELFEAQVRRTPEATAVVYQNTSLTYRELDLRANQLAHYLRAKGVRPDTRVAICVDRGCEMVVALLAVLKAGGGYVPLDRGYPVERLKYMLEDSAPVVLLTQGNLQRLFRGINEKLVVLDLADATPPWNNQPVTDPDRAAIGLTPEHLAYVIYTSGSTGVPKGVMVEHRNVMNLWLGLERGIYQAGFDCVRVGVNASLAFDSSVKQLIAMLSGRTLVIVPQEARSDAEALLKFAASHRIDAMDCTPSQLGALLTTGLLRGAGYQPRAVLVGGEVIDFTMWRALTDAANTRFFNVYGPTECTVDATIADLTKSNDTPHIGRPIANTRIYILDSQGQPVPIGVTGELHIGGAGVARGYLNRPELTAERFLNDPFAEESGARMYKTGDLGRWLQDGNIEFLGRNDDQVKLRGYRIALGEIESVLSQHPAVSDCVVIAREDVPGSKRLVAYITPLLGTKLAMDELRMHLRRKLPEYMMPADFVEVNSFPLTPNGKVDRKALPLPEQRLLPAHGSDPHTVTEIRLAEIWQEVLNVSRVQREHDFFDLGGHSLLAIKMIAQAREVFGQELPLGLLFQAPTLAGLADLIRQDAGKHALPTLIPIRRTGSKPPLFCVSRPNVNALGFIFLTRRLPKDQPVYGLQSQMKEDGSYWTYSQQDYETKAAQYIEAMRKIEPNGPYLLTGFCEGAHIAFEMARQLEAMDLPVGMIAILDAWPIENTISRRRFRLRSYMRALRRWANKGVDDQLRLIRQKLLKHNSSSASDPVDAFFIETATPEFQKIVAAQLERRYWPGPKFEPPTYSGTLTLFRSAKQDFCRISDYRMGWGSRALGGVEVIPIQGAHRLILREPYVTDLARKMEDCIRRALNEDPKPLVSSPNGFATATVQA